MPSHTFLRCGDYLKFLRGLRKLRQKDVPSYTFFSLWRLTWVFEGTWKNFHKKVCPVICFFAVETILNFWWDLESFDKKVWPFTRFFAVETNLSFWRDLEKFSQKSVPSHMFLRCGDYLKFLMGLGKFRQKGVTIYTFFRCGDYLKFLRGLGKFRQKDVPSYTFLSLRRLTWVFEGTWKNFRKKLWPVI